MSENQNQHNLIQSKTAVILVVDDDPGMRRILRKLIEPEGFQVVEATNGNEALEHYKQYAPDLVLLDAMMPIMDGFTCCHQLCNSRQSFPVSVLIITSLDDENSVVRAFEAGATDYITKPINQVVLRQRIHRLMQQSRLMQQVRQMNEELDTYAQTLNVTIRERTSQLQRSLEFESTLKHITDRVRDSLNENQILQTAVQELSWALELGCCNAAVYDPEQQISQVKYEYTASIPGYQHRMIRMDHYPEIYQPLLQGQPVQFCSLSAQSWRGQVAMFAFPIRNEQMTGDLWLVSYADRILDDLELRLVQQVVNQCIIAVRQARFYQAVQNQVQELEQLNQLKDDFLSTISHELRTPVANMKMVISLLNTLVSQDCDRPEELPQLPHSSKTTQYLAVLQEECDRELSLVEDLLSLQYLEAGTYPNQTTVLDLQDWIPYIIEPFEARIQNQQQTLQVNLAPNLPTLNINSLSLSRIITELLSNACKYTPPGGTISISLNVVPDQSIQSEAKDFPNDGPYSHPLRSVVQLIVCNSGVEIAPEEFSRIFDKFYRIPNNDPWKYGGTGLGLALVKKLLEQMGGTISVQSGNCLTQFIVQFPSFI